MATEDELARRILPVLVRRIEVLPENDLPITYGELVKEINYGSSQIGSVLAHLHKKVQETGDVLNLKNIPPITMMVVNQQGIPGLGASHVAPNYSKDKSKEEKLDILSESLIEIKRFPYWRRILNELGLAPSSAEAEPSPYWHKISSKLAEDNFASSQESNSSSGRGKHHYGSEGSPQHRALCLYVLDNPNAIGKIITLPSSIDSQRKEYRLGSGDKVDVVFESEHRIIGVEVKPYHSNETEIERGIYQCIKYQAVLEAQEKLQNTPRQVHTVLVIQKKMSKDNAHITKTLGVRHVVISQTQAGN